VKIPNPQVLYLSSRPSALDRDLSPTLYRGSGFCTSCCREFLTSPTLDFRWDPFHVLALPARFPLIRPNPMTVANPPIGVSPIGFSTFSMPKYACPWDSRYVDSRCAPFPSFIPFHLHNGPCDLLPYDCSHTLLSGFRVFDVTIPTPTELAICRSPTSSGSLTAGLHYDSVLLLYLQKIELAASRVRYRSLGSRIPEIRCVSQIPDFSPVGISSLSRLRTIATSLLAIPSPRASNFRYPRCRNMIQSCHAFTTHLLVSS
jgi:hypothetical protein